MNRQDEWGRTHVLDILGGCAMVVDPQVPHLGGNIRGGDQSTDFSKCLWPWLVKKYAIKSLLDVGCAEGHALRAFAALGVPRVLGVDGLWQNARRCEVPVIAHDLTKGPLRIEGIDFIWCCDTVEHIGEEFVPNVIATFACAKTVALIHGDETTATNGWHHVNNKNPEYWDEKMLAGGFTIDVAGTTEGKTVSTLGLWPTAGRIYVNGRWPREWPPL